jgi:NADPH:quinone reductase
MHPEATYRAVVCSELGTPETLKVQELPRRALAAGEVRVHIAAAGINFPDLLMIQGLYQHRPNLPFVPGMEAAGTIVEAASDIDQGTIGRSVMVRLRTGGYAEEAVVPQTETIPLPDGFSFAQGATFLIAHLTAYHALKTRADLKSGQTLLVLGAAGGVGLAAVQIGKVLGARVVAAASSQAKLDAARQMGADLGINYAREPIDDAVRRLTAKRGVDAIFDPVGAAQEPVLRCLTHGGKLLIAGFASGAIPTYAANRILLKGCSVIGVRAGEAGRHDPALRQRELADLVDLAARGLAKPVVSARLPLAWFALGLEMLGRRQVIGRIALEPRRASSTSA